MRKPDSSKPNQERLQLLSTVTIFRELDEQERLQIAAILKEVQFKANEVVLNEGEPGDRAYIVAKGAFCAEKFGHVLKVYGSGEVFGEIALLDDRPRTASIIAKSSGTLYELQRGDLEDEQRIPAVTRAKLYKGFTRQITSYLRQSSDLYQEMDVLLLQDGGCAPGYNPVTAYVSEYLEKIGRKVFIAAEGFKSIVTDHNEDYRCLVYSRERFQAMDHIPGVVFSPPLRSSRGAEFRAERYREFKKEENQKLAVAHIIKRKVNILVGIGGDGTFAGINALAKFLPPEIQIFFIPVTIDSDIFGTACIGEYTGVEIGAEKIRCYMADARTHKRCYIIEMMGAAGGYHALHSCLGAGAHLAVLPCSNLDLKRIAEAINHREETVIVVAEGYKSEERQQEKYPGNAAEYFRDELIKAGLNTKQRVICEPFSRDIRGAAPNNMDVTLAQRMARKLSELIAGGASREMPAVQAGREYSIPFSEIRTDNSVESSLAELANRLF